MIKEGDTAPDFELPTSQGGTLRLSDLFGRKVILFFYPKDGTPGCTRENCLIRDAMSEFESHGAFVAGISRDNVDSHRSFAEKNKLTHVLLSDTDGTVSKTYGVLGAFGLSKRVTFIIDEYGKVRKIIEGKLPDKHINEALAFLKDVDKKKA